jgi:hypothetical protein
MLTWMTIKIFEAMFATTVTGYNLDFLRAVGFLELFVEVIAVLAGIAILIFAFIAKRYTEE